MNNVTLDVHAVDLEKMVVMRKKRGGYMFHVTRTRDKLKSLLDKGASVDRIQRRIEVRAALNNLFNCNAKLIDSSKRAGRSEALMYYVEAENNCSEVLKLAEHHMSVECTLNMSSDCLEDNVDPEHSVSQACQSTKKLFRRTKS